MRVLMLNDYVTSLGGAEVVINLLKQRSSHTIDIHLSEELNTLDLDNYDLIHLNNVWKAIPYLSKLKDRKVVLSLHDFRLLCNNGLKTCEILKLNCVTCRGIIPFLYAYFKRFKPLKRFVQKFNPSIVVHSEYMKKTHEHLSPTYIPLPLEVEDMKPLPLEDRLNYPLFSGRCAMEKNPLDFAKLCSLLRLTGKMALHNLSLSGYFISYMQKLRDYPVDVYVDPDRDELFELYRHAKLAIFPNLFPEPFGISQANALLFEVPVLAYPFGNLKYNSTVKAFGFMDLVEKTKRLVNDSDFYKEAYERVKEQRKIMAKTHGLGAIKKWDDFYDNV